MKTKLAVLGLTAVAVIWGGGFVASDMALATLTPFQIVTVRFLLASVLMGLIGIRQLKDMKKEEIRAGILMGIALFAGFALQIAGLRYTTPSKNAFLTATNVVMVPFIALFLYRKRLRAKGIIGALLAILGVAVLSLDKNLTLGPGDGMTLLCAVGFAFQIILTGEFAGRYRVPVLNFVQMATAFGLSLTGLLLTGQFQFAPSSASLVGVLYLGMISTTLTYLLQTVCQQYVEETKAAIVLSSESVFGTLFSVLILREGITVRMVWGCVLIMAAVILSNLAEKKITRK